MRRACIDIGSNTTRLLVADCKDSALTGVHEARVFTRIGAALSADGTIPAEKVQDVVEVVADQLRTARDTGATDVRCVATASIRHAANGRDLVEAIRIRCPGLAVEVLSGEDEARLAFLGAANSLESYQDGPLAVLDVGGGSSELVVGQPPDAIGWWRSFPLGSGSLAQACLWSDPPSPGELADARARVDSALAGIEPPPVTLALAVGGSATSLLRLAGPVLGEQAFARSLQLLAEGPADEVSGRYGLDPARVRLLPAGLLILQGLALRLGRPLLIGGGGLREGVLLEAAAT